MAVDLWCVAAAAAAVVVFVTVCDFGCVYYSFSLFAVLSFSAVIWEWLAQSKAVGCVSK